MSAALLVHLCPGNMGHFLGALDHLGAASLAHEPAILEEALIAWEAIRAIGICHETCGRAVG